LTLLGFAPKIASPEDVAAWTAAADAARRAAAD